MKRWRYLIAAAVAADSMAAGAGAVDTADRDALLEAAVSQMQQQWQMDTGSRYIFVDGDNCHLHAYELIPEKNIYKICFSAGDSRLQCGVVNAATGRVIVPPQYDTLDVL